MFSSGKGNFDKLIDKATSQLLLEPDWNSILQICDSIRQRDVQPKYAFSAIRKKIVDKNPRGALYALQVLESCVKNCGIEFNEEVSNKLFMEELKELLSSGNEELKNKILELIQAWGTAFRNEPKMKTVVDMYNLLKLEGHTFPQQKESEAMFASEKAPEWIDGDRCFSCRTEFGITVRKHHCRHCGQIFCSKCTSKQCAIPKFGIERDVRVCDSCFIAIPNTKSKTSSSTSTSTSKETSDLPAEYLASPLSQQSQLPPQKNEREMQEQEELELALALSLDAAENKHLISKEKSATSSTSSSTPASSYSAPSTTSTPYTTSVVDQEVDPELARYLNRPYWEQKQDIQATPSAPEATPATAPPISQSTSQPIYATVNKVQEIPVQNGDDEKFAFLSALSASIDTFNNRMNSNSMRGRSIASDSTVQSLFMQISSMHPQLLTMMQELEDGRVLLEILSDNYIMVRSLREKLDELRKECSDWNRDHQTNMEALQDKLAQIKDAREALDALREDHREKLRQEAEEAERQRQIQLAQKLEVMRQKKQEYLQYQRQIAMQRLQEQEREMQMRLEQQKYHQQMRQMQYMPGMGMPPQGMMPGMVQHGMMSQGMQPGMTHQSGMAGIQQPPQGMQQPPQGMQQPPQGMQQPPQGMQQPPQGMQQPPQGMQQPPQGMQQPPQGMQQPPQGMQQHSQGMQQPSQGMQQPPQGMAPQNIPPQGMQQPQYGQTFNTPSSMHGSPSHVPYQQQPGQPPQQTMEQSMQRPAVPQGYNQPPPQYQGQAQQAPGIQGPVTGYQPMQYQSSQQFSSPNTPMEYTQANPYNMQSMSNALPQSNQPYGAPQGQMYQGGEMPPPAQVPQQAPQQVPQPAEASLISFD
ncbi:hepatocyte growth factor-regulated tyrosine kinase substrate-like isoform X2 [Anneissia japonica]|uniref:hepatocyte growth factor-regulated tyrosine kinase substrate-like isoform X2 n=1 Tax=Anneissia japonica TaxID=1529436 RepID=UPI0014254DAA|nr:hepatocyte growth factor-regulated tyrosine kinase substrate-like isoform X2 [Anneissia japonica]